MKIYILTIALAFFGSDVTRAADEYQSVESKVYHWNDLKVEKVKNRESRQILEGSTSNLDYLEIHASTLAPGVSPPGHPNHNAEVLVIVKEGQLTLTIEGESKVMGPGSLALVVPGDISRFGNAGETPTTYYILKFRSKAPMDLARAKEEGSSFMIGPDERPLVIRQSGASRSYIEKATAMFKRLEIHTTILDEKAASHATHEHLDAEIILVTRGTVEEFLKGKARQASNGSLIFMESEGPREIRNAGMGQCEYFAISWH